MNMNTKFSKFDIQLEELRSQVISKASSLSESMIRNGYRTLHSDSVLISALADSPSLSASIVDALSSPSINEVDRLAVEPKDANSVELLFKARELVRAQILYKLFIEANEVK